MLQSNNGPMPAAPFAAAETCILLQPDGQKPLLLSAKLPGSSSLPGLYSVSFRLVLFLACLQLGVYMPPEEGGGEEAGAVGGGGEVGGGVGGVVCRGYQSLLKSPSCAGWNIVNYTVARVPEVRGTYAPWGGGGRGGRRRELWGRGVFRSGYHSLLKSPSCAGFGILRIIL